MKKRLISLILITILILSFTGCFLFSDEPYYTLDANGGVISDENWTLENSVYTTKEIITIPTPEKEGYTFLGWYENDVKVDTFTKGGSAVAKWLVETYTIDYVLDGGENSLQNPTTYTYEDTQITLFDAQKNGFVFIGWFLENGTKVTDVTIYKRNLTLYASFASTVEVVTVDYMLDGNKVSSEKIEVSTKALEPTNIASNGYFIEWYTDENCTKPYNFNNQVLENLTLYGKEYLEVSQSFFAYSEKMTVANNVEELKYFIEYTFFNEIKDTSNSIKLNFDYSSLATSNSTAYTDLLNSVTCPYVTFRSGFNNNKYVCYVEDVVADTLTKTTSSQSNPQIDSINYYASNVASTRSADFEDFKYNNFTKQVQVKNSNQLFFALEHRVKPIPVANSSAENVLNKCKDILRQICDDSMTDEQKALAIYNYLVMNVEYVLPDGVESMSTIQALAYDAFYPEGIVNNGAGVCDGICKTFSILANLEGIRCVRAASDTHAWNEIFINGSWYTIDATHGNLRIKNISSEVLIYGNFLINEKIKESYGYKDSMRIEIVTDGVYDYYTQNYFTYNGNQYDFYIENNSELIALLKYCKQVDNQKNYDSFTLNVKTSSFITINRISNACGDYGLTLSSYLTDDDSGSLIIILK